MSQPYHLTPGASQGNAFTRHYRPEPSIFATDNAYLANASARASKAREECESKGINTAQIHGLGSEHFDQSKRSQFHVAPKGLDSRGRPLVDLAPRTTGAITVTKTTDAQRAKNQRMRKASL